MGGDFHNGADVQSAANNFALCGYVSCWSNNVTWAYLNSAQRLDSDVVYFSAHGDQDCIYLPNDMRLGDQYAVITSTTAVINDFYPLSNAKLYIYDACLTGSNGDGTGINLCTETIANGVDTVIGWATEIGVDDAYKWQKRFQSQLVSGYTAIVAANYANSFSDYDDNASIKAFRIYGNATIQIKKTRNSLTAVSNESTVSKDLSTSNISVNTNELYPALSAIKEINPAFSSSNYKVTVVKTDDVAENYTIDYMLMDGDFVTSTGYSIIVENGKAIRVQDNSIISTKHQYSSAKNTTKITDSIIDAAFSSAELHAKSINDGNVVTKQRGEAYLDIETGEHYYRVFTAYEASTGGFGAFSYLYPLD